jgi:hypothetical protein
MQTPVILDAPVILSGAKACPELAEGDPLPASSATSSARSFNYALATRTGYWQLGTGSWVLGTGN